jgi:hypothetical protein
MKELQTEFPIKLPNGILGYPLLWIEVRTLPTGTELYDKFGRKFLKGYAVTNLNIYGSMSSVSDYYMKV